MKERFTGHLGHVWSVHSNDGCETCDMVNKKKVGRRLKRKQNIAECPKVITEHVQYQGQKTNVQSPSQQTVLPLPCVPWMILCVDNILDEPVELPCKQMICCSCCFDHLKNNINSFCCASCKQNHLLSISSFGKPLTLKFMSPDDTL